MKLFPRNLGCLFFGATVALLGPPLFTVFIPFLVILAALRFFGGTDPSKDAYSKVTQYYADIALSGIAALTVHLIMLNR